MSRLLRAELLRLRSRRLVQAAAAATAGVVALMGLISWNVASPLSADELRWAEESYAQAVADWEQHGEEMVADCEEQQAVEREATGDDTVDYGCDDMAPQRQWYIPEPPTLADQVPQMLVATAMLLGLLALLVGSTATGAEMQTGSIVPWLTFEPRRVRVWVSKVVAVPLAVAGPAALALVAAVGAVWWMFGLQGADTAMTAAQWRDAGLVGLRAWAMALVAGVAGAVLGLMLRRTATVLGILMGYLVVLESLLSSLLPRVQPWLLQLNLTAWVTGEATYYVSECTSTATGTTCDYVEHTLTLGHAAGYLGALVAVVSVAGLLLFRRRDA